MGDSYTMNITGSNVGAVAVGPQAAANVTGDVSGGMSSGLAAPVSQQQYDDQIRGAQKALVDDQDKLEALSAGLYEALGQFLRTAKQIEVDQKSLAEVQAKMKDTLDDLWSKGVLPKLGGNALPAGLKFAETLLNSPLTGTVAKAWLGSP